MSPYFLARHLHIGFAIVSISLFVLRGGLMLAGPRWPERPWLRYTSYGVDTLLLSSALWLLHLTHRAPLGEPWLVAKILGIIAYVVLGSLALRRGRTLAIRAACLAGALIAVAWIVSVARMRSPWGFFGGLLQ